jgi:hypothetical protein
MTEKQADQIVSALRGIGFSLGILCLILAIVTLKMGR